jgi:mannose-6-phosphate isomerase-like protein (cupin superfamily)
METHINVQEGLAKLKDSGKLFLEVFNHGSLSVEVYKPEKVDLQQPHIRDEVYVIISGDGTFENEGLETTFSAGDFLFVKAGAEHRFKSFSENFVTWVFFYGPEGGEQES